MSYDNYTLDNGPVSVRSFERYGKNKFDMKAGLQGPALEIMKSILVLGRHLKKLEDALYGYGCDDENFTIMCKRDLHMTPGFARECILNYRIYLPDYSEEDQFAFYYLIAIPHEVLCATRPHVIQYLEDRSQGLAPNMWVTKKSIEFYIALFGGQPKWWDLKFLSLDQVRALPTLVAQTGPPPGVRSPIEPRTESVNMSVQPSCHYQDGGKHVGWDTSQEPPTPEEMNEMALREELAPFSQMPPDPIEMEEYLEGQSDPFYQNPPDPFVSEPDWQL